MMSGRPIGDRRGSLALRGQTFSVPHTPSGMTGAFVSAARRAAPQRPLSSGSTVSFTGSRIVTLTLGNQRRRT